ncbi:hypothetical protein [Alloscardovia macacae]|uniref:Uncharacterized protein n=1 Tax=Alloscardovia macacae TaxID=1160091 RepID=A0A261F3L8_9BIFI|nr:hypothetical protein [Alloscardovia macacae]OZG53729.1 hypothetical protein ALMA_1294 [Alloscardovia macacae]
MSIDSNVVYICNPAVKLIRSTNDEIIVRFGSRGRASRRLTDTQKRGILSDVMRAFEVGATIKNVKEEFEEDCSDLITGLVDGGVLVPKTDADFGFFVAGYGVQSCLIRTLNIIGSGKLAEESFRLVSDALGKQVIVKLQSEIDVTECPADFTLCVADSPNIGLFYDMNEYALSYNAVWHGGYMDGPELVIGPLFIPQETGCYHDFDVIEEAGRSMKIDYLYSKMNGAAEIPTQIPLFVTSLAASYLTSSIVQYALGLGSYLEGHFLRIDLDRMEIIRQRAVRLVRCPACSENRPDIRSPFL